MRRRHRYRPERAQTRRIATRFFAPPGMHGPLMPVFLVFAACAFASGFALRLADPIILPVAAHFEVTPAVAAMLNTAYALPYALAQPFLGPIGDRFGKPRCIQVCVAGLARDAAARRLRAELRRCCWRRGSAPASSPAA